MEHASNKEIYSVQATVRTYESGANGLMKPETVLHWFQEIAEAHASCLKSGMPKATASLQQAVCGLSLTYAAGVLCH